MIPIVPIIMAAATVANTIIQAKANSQNQENFNSQMQYNKDMQDAQNKYNLPTAQRQRYEDAGINPYLALSNITSGSQQSVMSAPPAPVNNPAQFDVPALVNAITQFQVGMAQSALLRSQKKNQDIHNKFAEKVIQKGMAKTDSETGKNNADTDFTKGSKTTLTNNQADNVAADTAFTKGPKTTLTNNQADNVAADTAFTKGPKTNLTNAQKDNVVASTDLLKFDLKFKKEWQSKIAAAQINEAYASARANLMNAYTNRYNAFTNRLSVGQQANYYANLAIKTLNESDSIHLNTQQQKKLFKFYVAKFKAEINNLKSQTGLNNSNKKGVDIRNGYLPGDIMLGRFKTINDVVNDDFKTIFTLGGLLGK